MLKKSPCINLKGQSTGVAGCRLPGYSLIGVGASYAQGIFGCSPRVRWVRTIEIIKGLIELTTQQFLRKKQKCWLWWIPESTRAKVTLPYGNPQKFPGPVSVIDNYGGHTIMTRKILWILQIGILPPQNVRFFVCFVFLSSTRKYGVH